MDFALLALAAPRRREILSLVRRRERSAGEVHRALGDVALYEIAWVYSRQGDSTRAERALEVLTIAAPESRYIPESATLFVAEDADLDDELAYGFALHLCYQYWPSELRAIKECAGLAQGYSEQAGKP